MAAIERWFLTLKCLGQSLRARKALFRHCFWASLATSYLAKSDNSLAHSPGSEVAEIQASPLETSLYRHACWRSTSQVALRWMAPPRRLEPKHSLLLHTNAPVPDFASPYLCGSTSRASGARSPCCATGKTWKLLFTDTPSGSLTGNSSID